jgi:hypothetical protein
MLGFGVVACGGDTSEHNSSSKPSGVIPEAQLEALDRAKEVEAMMIEADQQRRQQIDQSSDMPH